MPSPDPEKRREINRRWYERHKKEHKERSARRRKMLRQGFYEYKRTKVCLHCGEDDIICLEFHHIDPSKKDGDPAMMVEQKSWPTERLIAYLEETCIVLCSNCHKKVHRDLKQRQPKPNATSQS